jgi:hypothetical protein
VLLLVQLVLVLVLLLLLVLVLLSQQMVYAIHLQQRELQLLLVHRCVNVLFVTKHFSNRVRLLHTINTNTQCTHHK